MSDDREPAGLSHRARPTRRGVLAGGAAALAAATSRSSASAGEAAAPPPIVGPPTTGRLVLDDASRLNPTPIVRHVVRTAEPREALLAALRAELREAAEAGRPVAVGAARHSMGGQSLPRDGTAMTLASRALELDTAGQLYRVAAGARWSDVIRTLDPRGFSPLVMQSNHDFGVASTFCVNAHGWPTPHGPFGSTVRALRLMLADGSVVTCSPGENADLFAHAMGGYGLFGIILDLDVATTPNLSLAATAERMPAERFGPRFADVVLRDPAVVMAYGRLSLTRARFFEEALLTSFRPDPNPPEHLPAARSSSLLTPILSRTYRAQIGSERMKAVRWYLESRVAPTVTLGPQTRNTLMNEPVANLGNDDPARTDILHEYFVAPERFAEFLAVCRAAIPPAEAEFINVTLRYVAADPTARLAYATVPRIAAVMSFSQRMTRAGEEDMRRVTGKLIDGVLQIGGSYYLPYRLHATREQFARAYPASGEFAARKRAVDPGLLFRNALWDTYLA